MKYTLFYKILFLSIVFNFSNCKVDSSKKQEDSTTEVKETPDDSNAITDSGTPPYHISLEKAYDTGTGLHSFAFANLEGYLIMIGGRKNGFHGTAGTGSKFPVTASNDSIFVFDTKQTPPTIFHSAIPNTYRAQLSSTNMAFVQNGDFLICIGGYGSDCTAGNFDDSCYKTYPFLTAINLRGLVTATIGGEQLNPDLFTRISNDNFKVAGGELLYVNDLYYLAFGQNYMGTYKPGRVGAYTEQVRTFNLNNLGQAGMAIENYAVITDPSGASGTASEFHRRDLNVVPALRPDGSLGIDVYGGVFNQEDNAYKRAISIDGSTAEVLNYELSNGLYDCARIPIFDNRTKTMYTTLLGGIGSQYYNDQGVLTPDNLPFNKIISTVQHGEEISEYIQPYDQRLPQFLGANAIFIPNSTIPRMPHHEEIIDLTTLQEQNPNPGSPVLIGSMYGGIRSGGTQTRQSGGSIANSIIYNVYLNWN